MKRACLRPVSCHFSLKLEGSQPSDGVSVAQDDLNANAEFIRLADSFIEVPSGKNVNNYANVDLICAGLRVEKVQKSLILLAGRIAQEQQVDAVWPGWGSGPEVRGLWEPLKAMLKWALCPGAAASLVEACAAWGAPLSAYGLRCVREASGWRLKQLQSFAGGVEPEELTELVVRQPELFEDQEVKVVWEDEQLMGIHKPWGMRVYLPKDQEGKPQRAWEGELTVHDWLMEHRGGGHMCHRLDFATSGLMLVAKSSSAAGEVQRLFRRREVTKSYQALVLGRAWDGASAWCRRRWRTARASPAVWRRRASERRPGHGGCCAAGGPRPRRGAAAA